MPVFISMLRGVNVGGHNKIRMEELRALYESLGMTNPQTLIQSGNVVFSAKERNCAVLNKRISDAIERKFGFRPPVILRTASELRDVIAKNPFAARNGIDPSKLLVHFLDCDPGKEIREKVLAIESHPEELRMLGRELYIYFPNGMARPKLSLPKVERVLKIACTGRNWNTVQKLLEMAENTEVIK
ncbi:MAG TPA: DUF1697 domain-containing protein [Candidatus Acidoferrum sp.]|jgi:uncharacterized protein (DUF1697 family)